MSKTLKLVSIVVVMIFILSLIAGTIFLAQILPKADGEIGLITVSIDGRYANITADIDFNPDIRLGDTDLNLETGDNTIPVDLDGNKMTAKIQEDDFRSILEKDSLNLTGNVKIPLIAGLNLKKNLEEEINISFLHEMISTLNVSGVTINFSLIGYTEIFFLIDADVERDFILNITNTRAKLISPGGIFDANIKEMNFRTGKGGYARVSMPAISVLGLAIYYRDITIETWGISAQVTIPLFNG